MSKIEALELNALVARACALLGRVLDARIQLRVETEADLPPILGDPGLLEQMLDRVGLQEADALLRRGGGSLAFRTLRLGDGRPLLRIERLAATGAEGEEGGRAALLRDIEEVHGAQVLRDEALPGGRRLDLLLPACVGAPAPAPPLLRLDGVRILVAEDEPEMRHFLREILGRLGAEVAAAVDGEEAWRLWREEGPFDLVVTDYRMPRLDGLGLLARLRADHPSLPVMVTSGYGPEEFEAPLARDPRLRFLAKPFLVRALVAAAGELLSRP